MSEPLLTSKEVQAEIANRSHLYDEPTRSAFLLGAVWGAQTARKKMEARAQPAQAVPVLTDEEIDAAYEQARANYQRSRFAVRGQQLTAQYSTDWWFARAIEQAVRAKMGVAVPMMLFTQAQLERLWLNTPETVKDSISRPRFKKLVQFVEAAHGIVGKEDGNV